MKAVFLHSVSHNMEHKSDGFTMRCSMQHNVQKCVKKRHKKILLFDFEGLIDVFD